MSITVEASGLLAEQLPAGLTVEGVQTVAELIERLGLVWRAGMIILVNGRLANWKTELKAGDAVHLIPAIAGG